MIALSHELHFALRANGMVGRMGSIIQAELRRMALGPSGTELPPKGG
jgi:hypothetical protein